MTFSVPQRTRILALKSSIASYYNLQMKKISDRQLENYFYEHCVITGGCIASLFHNEAVNDIDVYAKTSKAMTVIKDHIILDGRNIKTTKGYPSDILATNDTVPQPLVTDNAVTLNNDVQFVYLGTTDECRAKFDFVHCMPWYDIKTQRLHISETQYAAIESKTLVLNISGEAVKDRRIQKYINKGWKYSQRDLKPVEFRWNGDPYEIGIIAQEIAKLTPGTMYINTPT